MRYSFPDLEPVHCSMSGSNYFFLVCVQVSHEAGEVVFLPISNNFLRFAVIHTVKGFGVVNKAEAYVFLEFSCFIYDPTDVGNLTSGSCLL